MTSTVRTAIDQHRMQQPVRGPMSSWKRCRGPGLDQGGYHGRNGDREGELMRQISKATWSALTACSSTPRQRLAHRFQHRAHQRQQLLLPGSERGIPTRTDPIFGAVDRDVVRAWIYTHDDESRRACERLDHDARRRCHRIERDCSSSVLERYGAVARPVTSCSRQTAASSRRGPHGRDKVKTLNLPAPAIAAIRIAVSSRLFAMAEW